MSIFEKEKEVVDAYLKCGKIYEVRSQFKTSMKNIKQILESNGVVVSRRKQPLNVNYFENIDSPAKAYWLGFITADGCIHKNGYKLSFYVRDEDILPKFKNAIGAGSPVRIRDRYDNRTDKTYTQISIQISSKEFCQYIKNHGVDEYKSKIFHFPKIKEDYYSHFIRGLYDGDGNLTIVDGKYRVSFLSTLECLSFIRNHLSSIGIQTHKITQTKYVNLYNIGLCKDAFNFLKWVYKDSTESIRLDRKYKKFTDNIKAFENTKRIIRNVLTGEEYSTHDINEFCRNKNFNPNVLRRAGKNNKPTKSGIHKGWILVPHY